MVFGVTITIEISYFVVEPPKERATYSSEMECWTLKTFGIPEVGVSS